MVIRASVRLSGPLTNDSRHRISTHGSPFIDRHRGRTGVLKIRQPVGREGKRAYLTMHIPDVERVPENAFWFNAPGPIRSVCRVSPSLVALNHVVCGASHCARNVLIKYFGGCPVIRRKLWDPPRAAPTGKELGLRCRSQEWRQRRPMLHWCGYSKPGRKLGSRLRAPVSGDTSSGVIREAK